MKVLEYRKYLINSIRNFSIREIYPRANMMFRQGYQYSYLKTWEASWFYLFFSHQILGRSQILTYMIYSKGLKTLIYHVYTHNL